MTDEPTQTERPHLTDEEREDLTVLASFDGDMLRAPVANPPLHIGRAIARGHRLSYFTLIDVEPHATIQGALMRVFKLTDAGVARFTELRKKVEQ